MFVSGKENYSRNPISVVEIMRSFIHKRGKRRMTQHNRRQNIVLQEKKQKNKINESPQKQRTGDEIKNKNMMDSEQESQTMNQHLMGRTRPVS